MSEVALLRQFQLKYADAERAAVYERARHTIYDTSGATTNR